MTESEHYFIDHFVNGSHDAGEYYHVVYKRSAIKSKHNESHCGVEGALQRCLESVSYITGASIISLLPAEMNVTPFVVPSSLPDNVVLLISTYASVLCNHAGMNVLCFVTFILCSQQH